MEAIGGSLSYGEFRIAAGFLVDKWTVVNPEKPPWTWISESGDRVGGYLSLDKYVCAFSSCKEETQQGHVDDLYDFPDAANLDLPVDLVHHYYDLHIVYSDSYRVPVLYFRAYTDDGSPLCMDDIEKDLPPMYADQLAHSKWTFITQEEHPYLNRPWYKLHSCGTSEWMKLLYEGGSSLVDQNRTGTELYLVIWLSVVGPIVGLKMPFEAGKKLIDESLIFKCP